MATIGVRELKAHLSKHLKRVQAGSRLTVTDRGRAIATLAPIEAQANVEWAHQMVREGLAHWSGGRPAGLNPRLKVKGKRASRMVIEDRR